MAPSTDDDAEGKLAEQPVPSTAACPSCGGEPEYDPMHVLSASGYIHDDIHLTCEDCAHEWTAGVPIGETEGELAAELFCGSCAERYMLPHRIEPVQNGRGLYDLHLKCPSCYYFTTVRRESDEQGVMLYGYPQITGDIGAAEQAYGYPEDHPDYVGGSDSEVTE